MYHRRRSSDGDRATAQEPDAHHSGDPRVAGLLLTAPVAARRPAVRTACILALAILAAEHLRLAPAVPFIIGISSLLTVLLLGCIRNRSAFSDAFLQLAFAAFVISWHVSSRAEAFDAHLESLDGREPIAAEGQADSEPNRSERSMTFVLSTDSVFRQERWLRMSNRLLVVVRLAGKHGVCPQVHVGDRLSVRGTLLTFPRPRNPGEFDYGRYLELNEVAGVMMAASSDSLTSSATPRRESWNGLVSRVQRELFAIFDTLHPPEHASFLKGVVWGYRSEISDDIRQSFVDTGTIHILAVSGSNVAFVVMALNAVLGLARIPRRLRDWIAALGLLSYMVLTGSSASVVRATVMGLIVLAGKGLERRTDVFNSIAAAVAVLLLWNTNTLFDVGFQLSFSAVLSLVYFSGPLTRLLKRFAERFEEFRLLDAALTLFAVSLAAQIGTIPFTAYYFGRVSVISLLANLVVVPVSGVNTIVGFVEVLSSFISPVVAAWYAAVNDALVWFLLGFVRAAAAVPGATVTVGGMTAGVVAIYYAIVLGAFNLHRSGVAKLLVFAFLVLANGWMLWQVLVPSRAVLSVAVLDVGQGDAILVRMPSGRCMLIDTGPGGRGMDAGERVVLPYLRRSAIGDLDALVITHAHDDHVGGLASVLGGMKVRKLLTGIGTQLPERMAPIVEAVRRRGTVIDSLRAGDRIDIDPDVRVFVVAPTRKLTSERNFNARSVVLRIEYGRSSILLTGDLNEEGEDDVMKTYGGFLRSDILKVGHHGSSTSTLPPFLGTVRPRRAVISVGQWNRFGHPSPGTLGRLVRDSVMQMRTDQTGAILLETDGTWWRPLAWR